MYKYSNNKNMVIAIIFACLLTITIGYAAFNQRLNIDGVSNISSVWSIKITNAELSSSNGNASEISPITYNDLSANFNIGFEVPGDSITYDITVTNEGTFNATLDSIKVNLDRQDIINFKVEGINAGETLLPNESKTFTIEFKLDETLTDLPDEKEFNISMDTNYMQEGTSSDFSDADSDTVNELAIKIITVTPSEYSIKVDVDATNAVKYFYSIDNNTWFESVNDIYTLADLEIVTDYTVYVKAEDEEGNVVISSINTATIDITKPTITYEIVSTNKGDNDWYKDVVIKATVNDNVGVKETYNCITTTDTCDASTAVTLTDNTYNYQFAENKNAQRLCTKVIDTSNNETTVCTDKYLVDGIDPTINDVNVTSENDTITVNITATDTSSGLYKYYYSKDSGSTYIESNESNYTFTNVDEGDYLILAYVKDTAGNVSEAKTSTTTVRYNNWCTTNGITDLGDCIIATEGKNTDIAIAKANIEAKSEPNFNITSPSMIYEQKISNSTSTVSATYSEYYIGTKLEFNTSTGMYTITDSSLKDPSTLDFYNNDYYILDDFRLGGTQDQAYKIVGLTKAVNTSTGMITYTFTKYNHTQSVVSYDTSEVGMYSTDDVDSNNTYYYRGSVSGNYVKFADKYWRIIRVNGDGSVRLIYDGTSIHANGDASNDRQVINKSFSTYVNDNTYVGYMYGDPTKFVQTDSNNHTFNYTGLSSTANYVFGTSYTFDVASRSYKVAGDIITGQIGNDKIGYYTCWDTNQNGLCQRLYYTKQYNSSTSMTVTAKGYGTTSVEEAQSNITDSTIKDYLENTWYPNNLGEYNNKLKNETIFCNNREIIPSTSDSFTNEGYGLIPTRYGYNRIYGDKLGPTLKCRTNDSFTVDETTGNGKLNKAVGLITIDENILAGATSGYTNLLYYLYSGTDYWTMSPALLNNGFYARNFLISASGETGYAYNWINYGVRPVINLDTSKITFTGNGTKENPYIVS